MTTASVVRTVSGNGETEPSGTPAEPAAAKSEPPAPHKSLMERAKETWKLWFGE